MAVYSSMMIEASAARVFRPVHKGGPAGLVVLQGRTQDAIHWLVIAGFEGSALPAQLTNPAIAPVPGAADSWRLSCDEGDFSLRARSVDRLEERPALFAPMHRRFALSRSDRVAVRVLLWLLRVPGGARMLRHWHEQRG